MSNETRKCANGHEFGFDRTRFLNFKPNATYITCPTPDCGDHVPIKDAAPDGTDWLAIAASNDISKSLFNDRVNNLGWTQERAATTLKRGAKQVAPEVTTMNSLQELLP